VLYHVQLGVKVTLDGFSCSLLFA